MEESLSKCQVSIRVDNFPFDATMELKKIRCSLNTGTVGAIVSFIGLCRDEGGRLAALEIEHFPDMAEAEISRIATQAQSRFPLLGLHIIHRYGLIDIGEEIVLVIAASTHRQSAFAAAEFVMDYLKTDAPFWKKQHWQATEISPTEESNWVSAQPDDLQRRKNWT